MIWFASFVKAADLTALLSVLAMLHLYINAFVALRKEPGRQFARNLCLGIVVGWTGSLILYGNLVWVYWTRELNPLTSPASPAVRAAYIALTLTGCSMHIATSMATDGRWWGTLALLLVAQATFVLAVMSLDLHGLM